MNFPFACVGVYTLPSHSPYIHQIIALKIFYCFIVWSFYSHCQIPCISDSQITNFPVNLYWAIVHPWLHPFHSFFLGFPFLVEITPTSKTKSTSLWVRWQNWYVNKLFLILIFLFSSIKKQIATATSRVIANTYVAVNSLF